MEASRIFSQRTLKDMAIFSHPPAVVYLIALPYQQVLYLTEYNNLVPAAYACAAKMDRHASPSS